MPTWLFGPAFKCLVTLATLGTLSTGARAQDGDEPTASAYSAKYSFAVNKTRDGYTDSQDAPLEYGYSPSEKEPAFQPPYSPAGEYRQPIAVEFIDARTAVIPTRLTGQIYELKWPEATVREAFSDAARQWGKVVRLSDGVLAVIDRAASSIVVFQLADERYQLVAELPCPGLPHSLAWSSQEGILNVTGQWSQRLYRFRTEQSLSHLGDWNLFAVIDLPMCGGVIQPLPKHGVILVMDAFGRDFDIV